ncbi:Xylose isomerase-like TIM barrel [Symmachiella dynata]|uniref:Xylose isomerase-like TIM barrel n=1 Tax=Symmachiella dynata TaxID=2527995 RepID=A0A517ZSA0_9PLAN|nr:sugar phosphate isomerase/epimerase [Symmachiella dynata]QDU45382.1 Xylose isomerase-like TIM barrel [Symmachiella dynata]
MKLSLSVRIAEAPCKTKLNVPFADVVGLARELGYRAVCLRASAGGVQSPPVQLAAMRKEVQDAGLTVSMVTADFDVPLNNEQGPNSLRDIRPSLDVAEAFECDLIRVCMKTPEDIRHARNAADLAAERGIRLAHQCHTTSIFEQVEPMLSVLREIDRENFGLIYEPANLLLTGEPYGTETLQKLKPHLFNVYVQNHKLDPNGPVELETWCRGMQRFHHIPIWETGGVDFAEVMAGLQAVGYDGYFTVHQAYAEIMGPREAAVESYHYLTSIAEFK